MIAVLHLNLFNTSRATRISPLQSLLTRIFSTLPQTSSVRLKVSVRQRHPRSTQISIDQSNIKERNEQLLLMWEIYYRALNVLVWFGPQSNESDMTMELLPLFTLPHHHHELSFTIRSSDGSLLDDNELSVILRPLEIIIQNPWWDWIWVVQEAALAHRALICYDQRTCEWNDLAGVVN